MAGAPLQVRVLDPRTRQGSDGVARRRGDTPVGGPPLPASGAATASPPATPSFLAEGIGHILGGYDHVLFLLCLLLPSVLRRTASGWQPVDRLWQAVWPVAGIVTAFTLAHSITLGLAALKIVSLPSSFIEPAIAVTIMVAALDNALHVFGGHRALVTFFFGLIHGFGFAGVLGELDLPAADFALALLQFNVGLELGQLAIVVVAVTLLYLLRPWRGYPRWVVGGGSLAAGAIALTWFAERVSGMKWLPL
jgi:hypothetical protein